MKKKYWENELHREKKKQDYRKKSKKILFFHKKRMIEDEDYRENFRKKDRNYKRKRTKKDPVFREKERIRKHIWSKKNPYNERQGGLYKTRYNRIKKIKEHLRYFLSKNNIKEKWFFNEVKKEKKQVEKFFKITDSYNLNLFFKKRKTSVYKIIISFNESYKSKYPNDDFKRIELNDIGKYKIIKRRKL